MTSEKLVRLSEEIAAWSARNFEDRQDPPMGVAEEIGELCHCFLKQTQKIRGFENPAFFLEKAADAVADATIYLLNLCGIHKWHLDEPKHLPGNSRKLVGGALMVASDLVYAEGSLSAQEMLNHLYSLAFALGVEFEDIVDKTWAKVSKRDWVKNPTNAHVIAEQS